MDDLCRTCLSQSSDLISVYVIPALDGEIKMMLSLCTGLEISKLDKLSSKICLICFNKLLDAYKFRLLCWNSNEYLIKQSFETTKLQSPLQNSDIIDIKQEEIYSSELREFVDQIEENVSPSEKLSENLICSQSFSQCSILKKHIIRSNKTIYNEELVPEEEKTCKICNRIFGTINDLRKHVSNHKIEENDRSLPKNVSNYKFQEKKHFLQASKRTYGSNLSNQTKVRECYLCPEYFICLPSLKKHLKTAHKIVYNEENIPAEAKTCKICNKQVHTFEALRKHITNHTHKDQIPAVCECCGKTYKNKENLKRHMRHHTGEKPYKCDKCDFRTMHPNSITSHKRSHTDERRFECPSCLKKFKSSSYLRLHQRIHTDVERPFSCCVCHSAFKNKQSYNSHMRIHDYSKYLNCSYCDKKFVKRCNLKTHLKQHTGERPHSCEVCFKGFIQRHSLRTHMQIHHKEYMLTK